MAEKIDRDNYCKDCKRSIYGKSALKCDINYENNGKYVGADEKCSCKVLIDQAIKECDT